MKFCFLLKSSVQESAPPLQTEAMRELFYQASLQKYNELCRTEEITADVKQRGETYFQKLLHLDKANNLNMVIIIAYITIQVNLHFYASSEVGYV